MDAVVNTVTGERETPQDGFEIRRAAVESLANGSARYPVEPLRAYLRGR